MLATLSKVIPSEMITPELVNFTVGITKFKPLSEIDLTEDARAQVTRFTKLSEKFSYQRLEEIMKYNNFVILSKCVLQRSKDSRTQGIKMFLKCGQAKLLT